MCRALAVDTTWIPDAAGLAVDQCYRALDFLAVWSDEIERGVFLKTADLFRLDVDLIFYDGPASGQRGGDGRGKAASVCCTGDRRATYSKPKTVKLPRSAARKLPPALVESLVSGLPPSGLLPTTPTEPLSDHLRFVHSRQP